MGELGHFVHAHYVVPHISTSKTSAPIYQLTQLSGVSYPAQQSPEIIAYLTELDLAAVDIGWD